MNGKGNGGMSRSCLLSRMLLCYLAYLLKFRNLLLIYFFFNPRLHSSKRVSSFVCFEVIGERNFIAVACVGVRKKGNTYCNASSCIFSRIIYQTW